MKTQMKALLMAGLISCPLALADSPAPPDPPAAVAQFLELTPEQAGQFRQMLDTLQKALQGFEQQVQDKQKNLQALLQADSPDDAAVGKAVLEIRAVEKQAGQALDAYHAQFGALLTPEQVGRVQAVQQAAALLPAVPVFVAVRLVEPPPTPGQH